MFKKILLGFGLFGLCMAATKSFNITLSEQFSVGGAQLRAGEYKLVVNGSTAVLEDSRGKIEANGMVQNETRKFNDTAVRSTTVNGTPHLQAIELGGTRVEVDFK